MRMAALAQMAHMEATGCNGTCAPCRRVNAQSRVALRWVLLGYGAILALALVMR